MRKKIVSIINKCIYAAILLLAVGAVFCYFYSNKLADEMEKEFIEAAYIREDRLDYVVIEKPWYSINKEDFIVFCKMKDDLENEPIFYHNGEFCRAEDKFPSAKITVEVDGETVAWVVGMEEGVIHAELVRDVVMNDSGKKKSYKKYDRISVYYEHAYRGEEEMEDLDTIRDSYICVFTGDDISKINGKKVYVPEIQISVWGANE